MNEQQNTWIFGVGIVVLIALFLSVFRPKLSLRQPNITNSLAPTMKPKPTVVQNAPKMEIDTKKSYEAILTTSMGKIVIALDTKNTPITANNYITLAKKGFYNGTIFHRVINGFMIQGGDPKGNGTGGPGYTIPDEIMGNNKNNTGTISMANAGPNTGGSQFFINLVNNNFLDNKHPVFGHVIEGMSVVEAIGKTKTDSSDRPVTPVTIQSISILEK